jgi:hypothetical protein
LTTTFLEEGVSLEDLPKILRTRKIDGGELLVGQGFLLAPYLMAVLRGPAASPTDVKIIKWSIPIDGWKTNGDSPILLCTLPTDEGSFTRLTFAGLLADGRREAILGGRGFNRGDTFGEAQPL